MRALLTAAAILLASGPAGAATYSLTGTDGSVQCILWDGRTVYTPPPGYTLSARPVTDCRSVQPPQPKPTTISAAEFQARFTQAEQQAIWAAAAHDTTGAIGAGLTHGLSAGQIDLTSPVVKNWLDGLVAAGAITAARETAILTP